MLVGKGGPGTDGEVGVRLGVGLVVVVDDEGQVVVVSVVVRVKVVAAAGEEGDGSSVWGRGRAVVVGRRREAKRRRLRQEMIESRDMVVAVVVFPGFPAFFRRFLSLDTPSLGAELVNPLRSSCVGYPLAEI